MSFIDTTKSHIRAFSGLLVLLAPACALRQGDDGAESYREAVPDHAAVRLSGPEDEPAGEAVAGSSLASEHAGSTEGSWARYYAFTRHVRDGVNGTAAVVLGLVWYIVHTPPTRVAEDEAVWGPYTEDLEPATYRLVVARVGQGEYDYRLEGRPKSSGDESEFRAVLEGRGFDKRHPKHGDGYFSLNLDVARALDPVKHPDGGILRIDHDVPAVRDGAWLPRLIQADLTRGESWWSVESEQTEQGGSLSVSAHDDLDPLKQTAPEEVEIVSRWLPSGAGRADVTVAEGDVPAEVGVVTAVECWGSDFRRSYYQDSVAWEPTEGDASSCVFEEAPPQP